MSQSGYRASGEMEHTPSTTGTFFSPQQRGQIPLPGSQTPQHNDVFSNQVQFQPTTGVSGRTRPRTLNLDSTGSDYLFLLPEEGGSPIRTPPVALNQAGPALPPRCPIPLTQAAPVSDGYTTSTPGSSSQGAVTPYQSSIPLTQAGPALPPRCPIPLTQAAPVSDGYTTSTPGSSSQGAVTPYQSSIRLNQAAPVSEGYTTSTPGSSSQGAVTPYQSSRLANHYWGPAEAQRGLSQYDTPSSQGPSPSGASPSFSPPSRNQGWCGAMLDWCGIGYESSDSESGGFAWGPASYGKVTNLDESFASGGGGSPNMGGDFPLQHIGSGASQQNPLSQYKTTNLDHRSISESVASTTSGEYFPGLPQQPGDRDRTLGIEREMDNPLMQYSMDLETSFTNGGGGSLNSAQGPSGSRPMTRSDSYSDVWPMCYSVVHNCPPEMAEEHWRSTLYPKLTETALIGHRDYHNLVQGKPPYPEWKFVQEEEEIRHRICEVEHCIHTKGLYWPIPYIEQAKLDKRKKEFMQAMKEPAPVHFR